MLVRRPDPPPLPGVRGAVLVDVRRRLRGVRRAAPRSRAARHAHSEGRQVGPFEYDRYLVDQLIHRARCPIFIVTTPLSSDDARPEGGDNAQPARPGDAIDLPRVLLPVWGSHGVSWGAEIGFSIARGSEMEVDVLHWVSAPRRRLRAGWDDATRHAVEIGEDLVGKVAQFGERLEARVRTGVSVAADPEEAFIEHAKRHPGLIVLESTRSPVRRRAFFGHEVDYLLRHAPCPVALISAPQAQHSAGSN